MKDTMLCTCGNQISWQKGKNHCHGGTWIPLYEFLKKPENFNDAWCNEDQWDKLSHEDKILMVIQESMAIALERWVCPLKAGLIQTDLPIVPKVYFLQALEKVCTTLCSGYFRDFAIENWKETHESFDQEKMMNFFESQLWINYINEKRNMDDTPNTLRNDSN